MKVQRLSLKSKRREEMIDITPDIRRLLRKWAVNSGMIALYVPHTTAAITINEGADPDVARDILAGLAKLAPPNADYRHGEGNSDAHIKASLTGPSVSLIVENGEPLLGTWQKIFFCEFDGPRTRSLVTSFIEAT